MQPFVLELNPAPEVTEVFRRVKHFPGCLLLDSALRSGQLGRHALGRYSFLMVDPFDWIEVAVGDVDPLAAVKDRLHRFKLETLPGLPPLQGGYAGLLSYDLNQSLETAIPNGQDEFGLPALALGGYDSLVAWDHATERGWIISTGFPETELELRTQRAQLRIQQWIRWLATPLTSTAAYSQGEEGEEGAEVAEVSNSGQIMPLTAQNAVPGPAGLTSNFSPDSYLAAVQQCVDYVFAGDVFQVNLAQRLLLPATSAPEELYLALRECNPATFSCYFDVSSIPNRSGANFQIISASPERLVAVRDRVVETRPIKGTRKRTGTPLVDIHASEQLLASAKDRAENLMIVDLMRNDLARCCEDDSVIVTQLCELEKYQSVFHLVSAVQGQLRPNADLVDLLVAVFPGGSVTGAPKHRAMQIIGELEPNARGAYCGSIGYLGFDGAADFNILIRTITACGAWWQIPVGGGIVSSSKPKLEYEETWTKAAGLLRGVEICLAQARQVEPNLARGTANE